MATLKDLMAQQDALAKQIEEMRAKAHAEAIAAVQALVAEHMLTQEDVFGTSRGRKASGVKKAKTKVAAKYRDPETGKEWSGRGIAPKWLQGKDKTKYLIA